ncbi:major facilitator superfamily MFS_1 [Caldalkalibacillus thermarum TA2.A1]|uniref:MFS transporter n=1 Tax=Caldalkalibacillus thermarum (strain TA2.A1) TaxID=986075 RepID=F5L5U2_CALTT|nr:MFS transporter [Caldalkalibacillus thermarum]EGL83297.1 major facilitator superfamily MFS_1 [Caldalkalibacillus thermarum TA2.A1]QZT33213.1 MFS transporter [Caldalkalibacillus thermarum TA2.A1]
MHYFIYFVIIVSFFDNFTQLPIISVYAQELGGSPFLIGLVVGLYSFSNMVSNVVAGRWIDRWGRKKIMVAGMLMAGVSVALYAFVSTAQQLAVVSFLHGIGGGLLVPAAYAFLGDRTKGKGRGQAMALSGAAIGVAAIVGPAYGGIIAQRLGLDWVFVSVAILLILTAVLVFLFLPDHYQGAGSGKADRYDLLRLLKNPQLNQAYLGAFALMFAVGILTMMLPLKVDALGFGSALTGVLMSVYGLVAIVLFVLPTNRLSDRLGRIKPMIYGLLLLGTALLVLSLFSMQPAMFIAMVVFGAGFALLFPAIAALVVDQARREERGRAFGLFYAFFSLGVVIGPLVVGSLAVAPDQGLLVGAVGILLMGIVLIARNRMVLFVSHK